MIAGLVLDQPIGWIGDDGVKAVLRQRSQPGEGIGPDQRGTRGQVDPGLAAVGAEERPGLGGRAVQLRPVQLWM
jgi:hypothetical protein